MNMWKAEILKVIKAVFGNAGQASDLEIAVCLIAAIFAVTLALTWLGKAFGAKMSENGRAITVVITGVILSLAAAAATNIYLVPQLKNALLVKWLPLMSCAVILVIIVTPIASLLLKAKYFQALSACLISIGTAAGIVLLVHGGFGALKEGDKGFIKTKERTNEVNEFLKK